MTDDQIREMIQTIQGGEREESYCVFKPSKHGDPEIFFFANRQALIDLAESCLRATVEPGKICYREVQIGRVIPNNQMEQIVVNKGDMCLMDVVRVDDWAQIVAEWKKPQKPITSLAHAGSLILLFLFLLTLCFGLFVWMTIVALLFTGGQ